METEENFARNSDYIYETSKLTIENFYLIVSLFRCRYKLSDNCVIELLKLICFLLPNPNKVKANLNKLNFGDDADHAFLSKLVCNNCWKPLSNITKHCENRGCRSHELYKSHKVPVDAFSDVFFFDAEQQLKEICLKQAEFIQPEVFIFCSVMN
jgi:hypothetical protein